MGIAQLPDLESLEVDGQPLSRARLLELAKAVDTSSSGTINYLEFLQAFTIEDSHGDELTDLLAEHITTLLFRHRSSIRLGCQFFDKERNGKVTMPEFRSVLESFNCAIS